MTGLAWVESLKGTDEKALKKIATKHGVNPATIIRSLERGVHHGRGFKWKFEKSKGGKIKILDVKHSKKS